MLASEEYAKKEAQLVQLEELRGNHLSNAT